MVTGTFEVYHRILINKGVYNVNYNNGINIIVLTSLEIKSKKKTNVKLVLIFELFQSEYR